MICCELMSTRRVERSVIFSCTLPQVRHMPHLAKGRYRSKACEMVGVNQRLVRTMATRRTSTSTPRVHWRSRSAKATAGPSPRLRGQAGMGWHFITRLRRPGKRCTISSELQTANCELQDRIEQGGAANRMPERRKAAIVKGGQAAGGGAEAAAN